MCQELPGVARGFRRCKEAPGAAVARSCPGVVESCQDVPGVVKKCQKVSGYTRGCQELVGVDRS